MSAELTQRLNAYVKAGAKTLSEGDSPVLELALAQAIALVRRACGTAIDRVPAEVLEGWYIEVAAELYNRKGTKNGVLDNPAISGSPAYVRRDPLAGVRDQMFMFLPGGFA